LDVIAMSIVLLCVYCMTDSDIFHVYRRLQGIRL